MLTICGLHQTHLETGCGAWDGTDFDLERITGEANRPVDCPFVLRVLEPIAARILRKLPQHLIARDEVIQEVFLAVLKGARRPTNDAELTRVVQEQAVDLLRTVMGRRRCTQCVSYSKQGNEGRCRLLNTRAGQRNEHFDRPLPVHATPHQLKPPCRDFRSARATPDQAALATQAATPHADDDAIDKGVDVRRALEELLTRDPEVGLVTTLHCLRGHTLEEVAVRTGLSRDQVKHRVAEGREWLKVRLKDLVA